MVTLKQLRDKLFANSRNLSVLIFSFLGTILTISMKLKNPVKREVEAKNLTDK